MLELSESLQRWEDDGGNSADTPNPLSTQRCTHSNREFSDNNGICPICVNVPYGGGNRDEVYLSDRWCLTPGPSATWDRREFSEAFSALANDFLASPDAVLDFLLNVSNPDSGYIRNPFGELQKKLADLRVKASREEESAIERHCANLEKQCGYLLSGGGDRMSAILRVDAARLDKNGCTGVILEARGTAYSWLKVRSAQQSALMNQAETHSVIPAVADLVSGRLIGQPVVREMNPDERSATAAVSFLDLTKTDPCSNPFHERDPRHEAWKLATRRAEEELAKITPFISEAYDVRLKNETRRSLSEVISVDGGTVTPVSMAPALIPMYGLIFDTWAWRGLVAVARDCDLSAYDEWLVRYARDLVECIGRTKHPEAGAIAAGVHQALHGQIAYWKSEARKQLREQKEAISPEQTQKEARTQEGGIHKIEAQAKGESLVATPTGTDGATAKPATPEAAAKFHKNGDIWTLTFDNHTVHIRNLTGIGYIAELLRNPHVPIEAAQLAGVDIESTGLVPLPGIELANEKTIKAVRDELAEKKTELAGLQERDWTRKGALQDEISKLERYLREVGKRQGQARRVAGTAQRARSSVTMAINRAIPKISESHPALGAHLDKSIERGTVLTYAPTDVPDWSF